MRVPGTETDAERFGVDGEGLHSFGYRYVLPVRSTYRARTEEGQERLRYSFLSLDRTSSPPGLLAGEYARRGRGTTRLARFALDPDTWLLETGDDGWSRPLVLDDGEVAHMQGVAWARDRYHLTVSHGPWPGSVVTGVPGRMRRHRWAVPMGPEDLAYWPSTDRLWSLTEHPHRRWIVSMDRGWFD